MTPAEALAAIDAARAQVVRARADWDRLHRVDGAIGTSAAGVYRDRLQVAQRAQALAELAARRVGVSVEVGK